MSPPDGRRAGAVTILRLGGIPVRAHWTLALGLPFFAWVMTTQYFGTTLVGWAWGSALAVALFGSVTIHEIAHSIVSARLGTPVREIILLPIGGVSIMSGPSREPRTEFLVAGVGPITSLLIGAAILAAALAAGVDLAAPGDVPPAQGFVLAVAYLNLSLGLFNLLVPAFPMDGGRLLRAGLARKLGINRATHIAAMIGRGFAILMGIAGLAGSNLLLVVIAVFVWGGASAEENAVQAESTLEGVPLSAIMTTHPATIAPDATLDEALRVMLETKHVALPVVKNERPVGTIRSQDIAAVSPQARKIVTVGELPPRALPSRLASEPAASALPTILEVGLVAVVDAYDRLLGVVTPTDIARTVQLLATMR